MATRTAAVTDQLGSEPFDAIIIGAGINGAGIARDAALRGLRVLLLDKGDIGGGTTSWSSRLIHGGLRYLEYREFGLVRESLRERERLLRIAPHLVKPLPLLIPIYKGDRRGPALIRLGMIAYDILSYDKSLDRHGMLSREAALSRAPGLEPEGLRGGAVYYDAQVEYPERLAVENVLDAQRHGAVVVTYARVDRLLVDADRRRVRGVAFTDRIDGGAHEARAAVVVNVAGPWVDEVLTADLPGDSGRSPRLIGGTKGSHIVVDAFPGAPTDALYVEAKQDGRPYFIIPWNGLYLIGTTDLRYTGDLDRVVATEDEIAYLLEETNRVIPGAGLRRGSVRFTYSGVRPLPYQEAGSEAAITRRHIIRDHAPTVEGLISIVGGKLTTYRNLAEQTVDAIVAKLGRPTPPSRTGSLPLPGAATSDLTELRTELAGIAGDLGIPEGAIDHLMRTYGDRARAVLEIAGAEPPLRAVVAPESGAIAAEVVFAVRDELAQDLIDVLMRRTMVGLGREVGLGADQRMAEVAVRHLGWSEGRAAGEVAAFREHIERFTPLALAPAGVKPAG